MPGMSGPQLAARLTELQPGLPVLFYLRLHRQPRRAAGRGHPATKAIHQRGPPSRGRRRRESTISVADYFPPAYGAPTALVVDDDPKACLLAMGLLESQGLAATSVSTLVAARAALTLQAFDLVVSDLRLSDGTATELTDHLRQHAPETATILSTAMPFETRRRPWRTASTTS